MLRLSRHVLFGISALAACGAALPATATDSLNDALDPIRARHNQPALAAAVVNSNGLLASGAVGVRSNQSNDPVTLGDCFHIGSCTKAMTATMIATSVEERAILWDTTIQQVFPDLLDRIDRGYASVTLRHLLTHTAGVPPATAGNSDEGRMIRSLTGTPVAQRAAMVEKLLSAKPPAAPGEKPVYSNAGYGVATAMLERATGKSWEDLMRERLFEPLKMTMAGLGWPATTEHPDQPLGHGDSKQGPVPQGPNHPYKLSPGIAPAGDVHCSIEDFARFAQLHLRGLRGLETLLKPDTIKVLHTPVKNNYACGWVSRDVAGQPAQWHNGSAGTFFTWMTVWPERDLAIVVATNAGTGEKACEETTKTLFGRFAVPAAISGEQAVSMKLTSPAFEQDKLIPKKFTCDGQDISPALQWTPGPASTKTYAMVMDDPDAPRGTWVHWVAWNITATKLDEATKPDATGFVQGKNSWGKTGYGGPCPPSGTHRYFFKLYALDTELKLDPRSDKAALEAAMKDHILAQAELMGTYARQK